MYWETLESSELEVSNVQSQVNDSELKITWFWPKGIDFVYLLIGSVEELDSVETSSSRMKLYTREEYKAKQGYYERVESIGKLGVRVFPCQKDGDKLIVLKQENDSNLSFFSTGRAKIYYSILYKKKYFQARKKVKMTIMAEIPVDREVLCYVKKNGTVPGSIEDGTLYPFVRAFPAGETILPEIELDKEEYIRIFFQNGKHAENFELIPN